ncbi:MAG: hypothetical protein RL660_2285 [Bacteroidota bacterium]|jgi:hypothetical protein
MKQILFITLIAASFINASAQDTKDKASKAPSKVTLRGDFYLPRPLVAFVNASQNGFHYPTDFGFTLGAERNIRAKKNTRIYQYGLVGFYNHVYLERVGTLATGLGFYRRIYKGFGTNFEFDVAYHRATSSHLASRLENGEWVSFVDRSVKTNRFAPSIGGNLEYNFAKVRKLAPLTIALGYNGCFVTPFDRRALVPFNVYHQPRFGVKWKW